MFSAYMICSRDLQRHLSTWWVSYLIHLLPCFCFSCWHILLGCIREMQTAMHSHGLLFWRKLRALFLPFFLFNKQLEVAWSSLEQEPSPWLHPYPEGGFGVAVLLINFWPRVDWKPFSSPCALVHGQGVPLISPTIWAVPSYCLIKTRQ